MLGLRRCFSLKLASPQSNTSSAHADSAVKVKEVPDQDWLPAPIVESCSPTESIPRFLFHSSHAHIVLACGIEHGKCLKIRPGVRLLDASCELQLSSLLPPDQQEKSQRRPLNQIKSRSVGILGW